MVKEGLNSPTFGSVHCAQGNTYQQETKNDFDGYRGAYGYRGYGVGAAAVGAAAVGAAATGAYYRSGCGYDAYGNWVCPNY
jgi:hypothetical protein